MIQCFKLKQKQEGLIMHKKKETIKPVMIENMKGGKKYVQRFSSIGEDDFNPNAEVVSRLVLIPGASIGYHEHVGNEEVITVLSGTGHCVDDGEEYELEAGDVTICREHHHHGIENTSETEELVLMAVVIKVTE